MPASAVAVSMTAQPMAGVLASSQSRALGDMRDFLSRAKPQTPSDALRLLRNAYPDAPLSLRVTACGL